MNLNEANQILGITDEDTQESIKKKYHKLIMLAHPDKGGSTNDFIKINKAWSVVNDPNEPSQPFEFSMPVNLADLFKNAFQFDSTFFGMQTDTAEKQKIITLKITAHEYLLGTVKKIKIPVTEYCNCKKRICRNCIGFGYRNNNVCDYCLGQCYTQSCEKCEAGIINGLQKFNVIIPKCNNADIFVGNNILNIILNEPGYFIKDNKLYSEFKITLKESLIGLNRIFKDPLGNEHNITTSKILHENDGFIILLNTADQTSIILIFKIIYPKSFSKEVKDKLASIL